MAEIRCPMCGKPNPAELDVCQFCQARLKPLLPSSPSTSQPIKAGEQPVHKGTAEFEKVKPVDQESIRPGEAPTKKNTAELERALPSWLRSLRGEQEAAGSASEEAAPSNEDLPFDSAAAKPPAKRVGWLDGLDKASKKEEEAVPDWLSGLRDEEKAAEPEADHTFEAETGSELGSADWVSRLDNTPAPGTSESPFSKPASAEASPFTKGENETPSWLKSLQPEKPATSEPAAPAGGEEKLPDWDSGLPAIPADSQAEAESAPTVDQPAWLDQLQEKSGLMETGVPANEPAGPAPKEELPDWLNQLQDKTAGTEPAPRPGEGVVPDVGKDLPDWLNQLQEKGPVAEPVPSAENEPAVPDWLANFSPPTEEPGPSAREAVPDWLSNLEVRPGPGTEAGSAFTQGEAGADIPHAEELPSWLSQLQPEAQPGEAADTSNAIFGSASEPSAAEKGVGPLPDWLAGIEQTAPPAAEAPAFIGEEKANGPQPEAINAKPFPMETPDWLSKLTPEQGPEEKSLLEEEPSLPATELEAAALPSWVQAMRPVESVVDQAKTPALDENQVTEHSGPLAGLTGVLPSGPGLGMSRKPPAYSVKLQVSNTQQRYISNLEQLVTGETRPSAIKGERQKVKSSWRWLISALLLLAVGVPFLFPQARMTPPTALLPSDRGATTALLNGLPANAPVLIAFDYDPALSGELEMTAAPLIDQLQSKGARLTLVSTSPTGPVLAERFFLNTLLVNSHQYKSGEQYVNLGYIAGGPAGISLFATEPSVAMPVTVSGQSAWGTPPLQGISRLSDFAAVIILTGDADTGRNWIEQSGQYMGQTPMVMVISAQAEPMVQPYFDSGQLKGLVSGLPDAKSYEQSYNRPGLANHYWDSFSLGALIAELIIAFGVIWSTWVAWRSHLSKPKQKA